VAIVLGRRRTAELGLVVGRSSWCEFKFSLLTFTSNVLLGPRQALDSQTDTCISLFRLIPRQSYPFNFAAGSSSTREEIQVENPPRSGKEVESTSIWTVQTRKYTIALPSQPN
jgi:hypothetical protein